MSKDFSTPARLTRRSAFLGAAADSASEELSGNVGIPADVLKVALSRQAYGVKPLSPEVIAEQQKIADVVRKLSA